MSRHSMDAAGAARVPRAAVVGVLGVVMLLTLSAVGLGASLVSTSAAPVANRAISASPAASTAVTPAVVPAVVFLENVTFKALGLPNGSVWNVTAGSPPATQSNTTVGSHGLIVFQEPNGTLNFSIQGPAGFGVAKVVGKGVPSQTSDVINGTTEITVVFRPIVTLTFNETGLLPGTVWGIAITSALPHGGPAPQNATTNGTSISFSVVKGTYHFVVTPMPADYRAMPHKGTVGAGHPEKLIRFKMITAAVVFKETGLAPNTLWQVNVTGSLVSESLNSTRGSLRFNLPSGNYTFTVWNFTSAHPTPESGSFTVVAPGNATVEQITYS